MNSRGCITLWLTVLSAVLAASGAPRREAARAPTAEEQAYEQAKAHYETNYNDDAAALQFSRACFDWADKAGTEAAQASVAREGMQACRRWLQRAPEQAAAHYYLAMNIAQLARTKKLGALTLVRQMEKEWLATLALDAHYDFAGADRNLGLLYRDAPGFPLSIGHRSKAEQHLQHAVELDPEYPENHLNLIETDLKRDPAAVAGEEEKLRSILPAARKKFTGPEWQSAWDDWNPRLGSIPSRPPSAR